MAATLVIMEFRGIDARIPELHKLLGCSLYGRPLGITNQHGERGYYIAIVIIDQVMEEDQALSDALKWIDQHMTILAAVDADTSIEIQTTLLPGDGSRAVCVSAEAMEVLVNLECDFRHQYFRTLTQREMEERAEQADKAGDSGT